MILYLLLKLACLATCMAYLTPTKYPAKKSAVYIIVIHFAIWVMNSAVYLCLGEGIFNSISLFTIGIPGFFCFNFLARYKGFRVLLSLLTVTVFGMFSSFLGNLADIYFNSAVVQYAIKFTSFILITIYIARVLRKPYLKLMQTLEKGWGPLSLIPLLLINIICLMQYFPTAIQRRPENIPAVLLLFLMTFVFYTFVYGNFERVLENLDLKREREVLSVQAQMYKNEYKALMDNVESARIFRHDMRHHINTINTYLNDGSTAEVRKYVRKLDGSLTDGVVMKYCENYGVNVVLSALINRAASEGIEVSCEANIPEDITIDSMELGLVFANALDNAINACRKLEDPASRRIDVDCREHYGQIYIRISNPFAGEVRFDGEFPVAEGSEHGIGTKSIAAIAEKHGGIFSFIAEDGIFMTSVTMKL